MITLYKQGSFEVVSHYFMIAAHDFLGEMGYVKHDVSKAIKTVLNSASGGFREQAVDLKRVSRIAMPSWERP